MKIKLNIKGVLVLSILTVMITTIGLFFINTSFAVNTAKIVVDTANLREKPDSDAKILELINKDENVEIIETSGEWYKVKHKNVTGYLRNDLMTIENQTEVSKNTITENQTATNVTNENTTSQQESKTNEEILISETKAEGKYKIIEDTTLKVIPLIHALDIENVSKDTEVEVISSMNCWGYIKIGEKQGWAILEKMQKIEEATKTETEQNNKEENPEQKEEQEKTNEENKTEQKEETTKSKKMYVNSNSVNVRSSADRSANVVTQISINTEVEVLSEENGWSKVTISGKQGYILSSLLSERKQETSRGTTQSRTANSTKSANNTNNTNNTSKASNSNNLISTIDIENRNNAVAGGANQGTSNVASTTGTSIVEYAKQFIGVRYTYGGSSPSTGFDCSGFTSYVYRNFGISLPRTSGGQAGVGTAVSRGNLAPGDLVIYSGHVAIYVGGGNVIHAPRPGKSVCIVPLNQAANSGFLTGRRVV